MTRAQRALLFAGGVVALAVGGILLAGSATRDFARRRAHGEGRRRPAAAGFYFYELCARRPAAPDRRALEEDRSASRSASLSIALYFNAFKLGYEKWYHRHDQYHYYMGAKYFPELGYDGLYSCTLIAEDELGRVEGRRRAAAVSTSAEARHGDRKIRDLGGDNLLIPAAEVLDEPEECKGHFSTPQRWEAFKQDMQFFRIESDKEYWEGMQKDHGYNPPPVWTLCGRFCRRALMPASVGLPVFLASLDIFYRPRHVRAIAWAFGWRIFAVAAILWGCEGAADPYYWTGGAFLRQDWLFFLVLAACLRGSGTSRSAAASMVHAGLAAHLPGRRW